MVVRRLSEVCARGSPEARTGFHRGTLRRNGVPPRSGRGVRPAVLRLRLRRGRSDYGALRGSRPTLRAQKVFPLPVVRRGPMRLQQLVKDERRPRDFDPREYISTWTEKDLLHGKVVDAWVIIFRTRGCYWARASGCSMCGYVNDVAQEVEPADILHQLDTVLGKHESQPMVKVYTSGNFFDDHEVAPEVREKIL